MLYGLNEAIIAKAQEALKKLKTLGIIASIIMIILGIVTVINPGKGNVIGVWLMVIGVLIYGIMEIVIYCKLPKEIRNGASLAMGIIWVVLCVFLIIGAIAAPTMDKIAALGAFDYFIAVMIAFSMFFSAISEFCSCKNAEALGRSKGGMIASGILGILCGIIILTYPIGSVITLIWFYGLFLLIGGISLFCRCMSY